MPLNAGTKLGAYEIVALIGAGGMGEVYRAKDTRLKREVAIKVLPDAFASDPDRLARFQREAELLATLNHPNIAHIHGLEELGPQRALILELVDGPTLAERIAQGALPLDEALPIARQIAAALEAAHERGVVHRDLKPANIKVTAGGQVKVLDFGLAKLADPSAGSTKPDPAYISQSPTFTSPLMTMGGVILGTAAYMSPEQARGRPVDKRTDIWAFGCVLYEMVTSTRAFPGEDVTDVLAAIIKDEPPLQRVPVEVRRLLNSCLQKDARERLRDIGDAWRLLDKTTPPANAARPKSRRFVIPALTALVAMLMTALAFLTLRSTAAAPEPVRFQIVPPQNGVVTSLSVSPDGRHIAFAVRSPDGENKLWVRSLDSPDSRPLNADVSPGGPFWSPDSRFIGFAFRGDLKKIDAAGGTPQVVFRSTAPITGIRGGAWSPAGVILVSQGGAIVQIPDSGGTPVQVIARARAAVTEFHGYPSFLPDGRRFLYLSSSQNPSGSRGIFVGDIGLQPDQQSSTPLLTVDSPAVYVPGPTADVGDVLFVRDGSLTAQPLNATRLELTGEPVVIADDVSPAGTPLYSGSNNVLAFRRGAALSQEKRLLFHDRAGTVIGQLGAAADYRDVTLSRDGKFIAVDIAIGQQPAHVWTGTVTRGVLSRLIPGDVPGASPTVSSDGRVAFSYSLNGVLGDIYTASMNGVGAPELLVKSDEQKHPNHFSRDGRFLIYDAHHGTRRQDLWVVPTSGDRKPIPFLTTVADESFGQFSPDGKWVAYSSNESGKRDVYVQGFSPDRNPAAAIGKWLISTAGGDKPRWSANGKELYYLAPDLKMMAVPVTVDPTFEPGMPVPLFPTQATSFFPYDVTPDGRFLINTLGGGEPETVPPVTVALNWRVQRGVGLR